MRFPTGLCRLPMRTAAALLIAMLAVLSVACEEPEAAGEMSSPTAAATMQINPLAGLPETTPTAVPAAPTSTQVVVALPTSTAVPMQAAPSPVNIAPTAVPEPPTAVPVATNTAVPVVVPPTATAVIAAPIAQPSPTPVPAAPVNVGGRTWYTSAHHSAQYYYCDLDSEWKNLSPANLRAYSSEAELQAAWGASRVKYHSSAC